MWVHLYDPHLSYNPPPAFRRGVDPELSSSLRYIKWNTLKKVVAENDGNVPAEVLEHARLLYRGEVEYTDRHVGRLLRSFDRLRDRSQSMVVLTADHGECFENGIYLHPPGLSLRGNDPGAVDRALSRGSRRRTQGRTPGQQSRRHPDGAVGTWTDAGKSPFPGDGCRR